MKYINGNAEITLQENGTRIIEYEDELKLDYPTNVDIRVSTSCSFADNICKAFCYESALVNGKDCDYEALKQKLIGLPKGIELAIGCNHFTENLYQFLDWCNQQEYICNLTINQGHINRDFELIEKAITNNLVKGLGISYRKELKWIGPQYILDYSNTIFHIIVGIDSFNDVMSLKDKGVKKLLCLGEKNVGFNQGKVNLQSINHKEWYWWVAKLFSEFEVVSFDNLALEQLNIKRFFNDKNWDIFNQGEYSFYIDAVNQTFAPSSRSKDVTSWKDLSISEYFKNKL
jgi:hypothetical protein